MGEEGGAICCDCHIWFKWKLECKNCLVAEGGPLICPRWSRDAIKFFMAATATNFRGSSKSFQSKCKKKMKVNSK